MGWGLDLPSWGGPTLVGRMRAAGASTLAGVVELAGPRLDHPDHLAAVLGIRSVCCTPAAELLG